MQVIDLTPDRTAEGKISFLGTVQGMLKYGLNYPQLLAAQDIIQAHLKKGLGAQFYLLRNLVLPNSKILVPFILVGPPGIYVIVPAYQKGIYQARDMEWGTLEKKQFKPASINLVKKTANLARAVSVYLKRQGIEVKAEGVLMAANPGIHIETMRPAVRVLMYDAIKGFVRTLAQERGILSTAETKRLVQRLQKPRRPGETEEEKPENITPESFYTPSDTPFTTDETDNLADAFGFNASEGAEEDAQPVPAKKPSKPKRTPSRRAAAQKPSTLPLGLTAQQWLLLVGMFVFEILIIFGFLIYTLMNNA